MTEQQQAACAGKQRFDSKSMAEQVNSKVNRRNHVGHSLYRCVSCGGWHIGSHVARPSKGRK